jgi:D-erythro-7,8-dihydroneopterin triphosphate epimerase
MVIRIKNLRLRAIIGVHDWERAAKQDVVVNIEMEFDGAKAARSDDVADTVDYSAIKRRLIEQVEKTDFKLLEKLVDYILGIVMEDPRITRANVEVDKPHALRFADSVSLSVSARR